VISLQRDGGDAPKSIAVLAPALAPEDTGHRYFADGMADELTTALSKVPGLRVAARTSAFAFRRDSVVDFRAIGRQLNVESVLIWSMRRSGARHRINAQLTSTLDGRIIFADDFFADTADFFARENDLAQAIVRAMEVRLATTSSAPIVTPSTNDIEAHEYYLRGRYVLAADDQAKAIEYFLRAVQLDSGYAAAWSGLADAYYLLAAHSKTPTSESLPKAKAAALRAIALDSTLAEARVSLANTGRWWDYDRAMAAREFTRALQLNPRYAEGHLSYGWFLMDRGDTTVALAHAARAVELDPLSPRMRGDFGHLLLLVGRVDSAMAQFQKMLEFDPTNRTAALLMARALVMKGKFAEASGQFAQTGLDSIRVAIELARWSNPPVSAERARVLVGIAERASRTRHVPAEMLAMLHLRSGSPERALDALDRGLRDHDLSPELKMMPEFAALRDHARFKAVLRGIGSEP
jgi:TolB-like protein